MKFKIVKKIKGLTKKRLGLPRFVRRVVAASEAGRTMVEILAVLAIVGVLSIGSISLYRYSLNVIMANSIVTGVKARSVIVANNGCYSRI